MERKTQQSGHTKELLLLEIIEDRVVSLMLAWGRLILVRRTLTKENHSQQDATRVMTIVLSKQKYWIWRLGDGRTRQSTLSLVLMGLRMTGSK